MSRRTRSMHARTGKGLALLALCIAILVPGLGSAHATRDGFSDSYETLGPVAATPGDNYEVRSGSWSVSDIATLNAPALGAINQAGARRVLVQDSRAATPNEPILFVRGREFREFTAQVTAALLDDTPGASVGMIFRAPIREDATADPDNLYLFTAAKTGIIGPFTTGQAFILFKRVGNGYFMLTNKIANTRFDLKMPHDYKVVMSGGHIQAFVDGRLVIDHVDRPSGDFPTTVDPFPGLPFDRGAIGLRTSGARAWFDDLIVVGREAYEGRASAIDVFAEAGIDFSGVRNGAGAQLTSLVKVSDTGFRYHDHDGFDDAVIEAFDPFASERFSAGADLRTRGVDGSTLSTARLSGVNVVMVDPLNRFTIQITAHGLVQRATASCSTTTSRLSLEDAVIKVTYTGQGVPGVSPQETTHTLEDGYAPNHIIHDSPGQLRIIAHALTTSPTTRRVEASAFKIVIPDQAAAVGAVSSGQRVPNSEITIGNVVAARYCA